MLLKKKKKSVKPMERLEKKIGGKQLEVGLKIWTVKE